MEIPVHIPLHHRQRSSWPYSITPAGNKIRPRLPRHVLPSVQLIRSMQILVKRPCRMNGGSPSSIIQLNVIFISVGNWRFSRPYWINASRSMIKFCCSVDRSSHLPIWNNSWNTGTRWPVERKFKPMISMPKSNPTVDGNSASIIFESTVTREFPSCWCGETGVSLSR